MATRPITKPLLTKPLRRSANGRLTFWLTLGLVAALALLIYGAFVPSPPSAFDSPAAQMPFKPDNPWVPVHSM